MHVDFLCLTWVSWEIGANFRSASPVLVDCPTQLTVVIRICFRTNTSAKYERTQQEKPATPVPSFSYNK